MLNKKNTFYEIGDVGMGIYKKGTDLPAHTDRPECEYTVSFIIDKPENCNWNIYVHKTIYLDIYRYQYIYMYIIVSIFINIYI